MPWADCHFSVSLCTHHLPPLLRFFLRGGGSVHRLFSVCALGRLSFQFRIPTKPLLSLQWVHSVIDFATLGQVKREKPWGQGCPYPYWDHTLSWRSRGKNSLIVWVWPNKPFFTIDLFGDFIDIIISEIGTCCIIIQSDWNQNKIIVGIRMLYPNKNWKDTPFCVYSLKKGTIFPFSFCYR